MKCSANVVKLLRVIFGFSSRNEILDVWEAVVIRMINLGKVLKILPCSIDPETKLVIMCGKKRQICWYLMFIWYWLDLLYLIFICKRVTALTVPVEELMNFYMHFFSRLVAGVLSAVIAKDQRKVAAFMNLLLLERRKFKGEFLYIAFDKVFRWLAV